MPQLVAKADILVEQVMGGLYGVGAVEGLAAGRLVVGFVGEDVRQRMPESPPIVDAPPNRFRAVIEDILDQPEAYVSLAAEGPAFARRWHDGTAAAAALEPFLASPSLKELP
jgi:hypothetical protein